MLCDPELQAALQRLLHPPHKVVALLCGVSEDDVATECFEDWSSWRKLYAEDEPALYVSTVLESISDSTQNLNTLNYIHNYFFLVFYLTCSAISQSRLFWCELPSFGEISCRDFCLLSDIMGLNGALNVVVTVPQSTFESSSVLSLFRNGALLMQNNPQTLL